MAKESEDVTTYASAIRQVLENCILSKVEVEKMPIFAWQWLYLQIIMM